MDVVRWFGIARTLHKAASHLNVRRHPDLLNDPSFFKRGGPAKIHPVLTAIFYNCSLETVYRSLGEQIAADTSAKGFGCIELPLLLAST